MADRVDPYYYQEVTEDEVEQWHDQLEAADQAIVADQVTWGITSGLVASELAVPDMKVRVTAGAAYDEDGQRIVASGVFDVDLAAYEPAGAGDERWVAVYVEAARAASDARVDGDGAPLNYLQEESYAVHVEAGAIAVAPGAVRPAIVANMVLVCCVRIENAMGTIVNADISQDWFNLAAADVARHVGGAVAPGRLLGEEKRIAFDPAVADDVIVIGAGNTLDADGGAITMGAGQIDTEGGTILLGTGDLDTEGGDVLAGGGNVNLELGHVTRATSVGADEPDATAGEGHLYATPATGVLIEVRKPWDIPAASFLPANQTMDPWVAAAGGGVDNEWALSSSNRALWRCFWNGVAAAGARTGVQIVAPIFVPNKSRLVRVTLSVDNVVVLPANLSFVCGVASVAKDTGALTVHTTKAYTNASGGIWAAGTAGIVLAMSTTDAVLDVVLGDGFTTIGNSYFVYAYLDDTVGVGNDNYISIFGGTANALIREASHEY